MPPTSDYLRAMASRLKQPGLMELEGGGGVCMPPTKRELEAAALLIKAAEEMERMLAERDEAVEGLLTLDKVNRGASVPAEDHRRAHALIAKHEKGGGK